MRYRTRGDVIDTEDGKVLGGCANEITAQVVCSVLNSNADEIERLRGLLRAIHRRLAPGENRTFDQLSRDAMYADDLARTAINPTL